MAFTTDRSGSDEIWLRSQTGDFERPLVTARDFPREETYLLGSPAFSPDGQRVAYYREGQSSNHVWVSPVAGGPPVELASAKLEQDLPTWSPDGNWIAFPQDTGTVLGLWSVMKVRVGTTAPPQVVVSDIVPLSPVKWSPDGAWIAYDGREGLSVVSPDGGSAHAIYDQPWLAFAWSEDSRRLFGIRQSDDYKHLTLTSIDINSRSERVHAADFLPMPVAARPVRGFTRVSATTFLTSIIRVSSDIWLLDGIKPVATSWARALFLRR
jgi:dipeptidyl aminopeptidase/acylaminoacyl peptidase